MSSIDERIVQMKFNNGQFESGVKQTNKSLDELKSKLNLDGARKGLEQLNAAGQNFSLAGITNGVQDIAGKLTAMGVIGITALANITTAALNTGAQLVKSLTIDPIKSGLEEYETNLNAIQTILANTSAKGSTLTDVNAALKELNEYSDKTIYNFSEMARNIGTFTAAGVDLKTSTEAIKGIANLAAVSGSNSQQASTAMYQLSQALSTGKVSLMDWNSVVNAGMGGQVFQDAIKETARVHGVAIDDIINDAGSFRDSLQEGWLTSDILTETLSKFTGDLNEEQLRTMGYNEEQIVGIIKMGQTAQDAATKVKTMSQLIGTLQEASGSGWSQTWQIIFGDFEEAKELFTSVNNVLGGMIGASADARNKMMQDWKDLGGRTAAIDAVKNAFNALMAIFKPVSDAFKEIFPPTTGQQLFNITAAIRDFTAKLMPSEEAITNIRKTARGFFAVLDIGWMVIQQVVGVLARLFSSASGGSSDILKLTGSIGDFLVNLRASIKNGEGLGNIFRWIGDQLEKPVAMLKQFVSGLTQGVSADGLTNAWENIGKAIRGVYDFIKPAIDWVVNGLKTVWEALKGFFESADFNVLVGLLNAGALAGVFLMIKSFMKGLPDLFKGAGGGFFTTIKESFSSLTDTMEAMQAKLRADALIKIGIALAIIAASVLLLSFIDPARLGDSVLAMSLMFAQLMGAMKLMEASTTTKGVGQMAIISVALVILATALLIMTAAVSQMAELSWEEIARGLSGLAGALVLFVGASKLLAKSTGSMVSAAIGIGVLAASTMILAAALAKFAALSWDEIGRGMVAMSASLAVIALFSKAIGSIKGLAAGSVGIVLIATAMLVLAAAVNKFGEMSVETIAKGLIAMAGALVIIGVAMNAIPVSALASAAVLLIVGAALVAISQAFKTMGNMSWDEIGRGMTVLAGSLIILAGAMYLLTFGAAGAVVLPLIALGLMMLAPVLVLLGSMSWEQIGTGLGALASALGILAVAGVLLLPALPGLLGLGAAIALIGVGALAAGIGIGLFAAGFAALGAAGAAGAEGIKTALLTLISVIPEALVALANGLIQFALVIAGGGVEFTKAMTTLMMSLLEAINTVAPEIVNTLVNLIMLMVNVLVENIPLLVDAGLRLLTGILDGIANNIGNVINSATNVIVAFVNGIGDNVGRVIQAGVDLVIDFVNGVANAIRNNTERMNAAGRNLADAIVDGMTSGIRNGIETVANAARTLANNALNAAKNALGIHSPSREFKKLGEFSGAGYVDGLDSETGDVKKASSNMGTEAVKSMRAALEKAKNNVSLSGDMQPVIRPVMDLSNVKSGTSQIRGMLASNSKMPGITMAGNYSRALELAQEYRDSQPEMTLDRDRSNETRAGITFIQNNNSPKSLSSAEIYRNTKSQISVAKEQLTKNDKSK